MPDERDVIFRNIENRFGWNPFDPNDHIKTFVDDSLPPGTMFVFDSYIFPFIHNEWRMGIRHDNKTCQSDKRRVIAYKVNQ